ncbi:glycosyltransferase family 2 protein [Anabaena sp. CA = ATCC 33047]|uniref:glycosyltransferase family 2 protein n=1 Tax=Anabaena sp. (strain CA / ATCC 33047) TaxID=52271 RepID=UPI000AE77F67|nr:glycosyltransferase family A protein [Anabaena sp. CA = ATCC 33047]
MKSHTPLVSVIIPAYNAEKFIGKTLHSVLSQTYKNIEVLVVDDGSLDQTAEIVESFAQTDHRVILLKQQNQGVAIARNLAITKSEGEYIAPIDADDIWYSQKLEKQVQCLLNADDSVGLVYAWSAFIDEDDAIIGKYNFWYYRHINSIEGEVYKQLLYTNFIGNASVPLIRRECFDKVGYYNSELKRQNAQGCEDWDIYLRIAEHYKFRVVREFLVGYRQVNGSMSRSYLSMEKSYNLVMQDSQKKHPEIPNNIFNWSASYFQYYLAQQTLKCDDYGNALLLLYKAVRLDVMLLLHPGVYKCILNIIIQQLKTLIKEKSHSRLEASKPLSANYQITDINQIKIQQQKTWKIYDMILSQRLEMMSQKT